MAKPAPGADKWRVASWRADRLPDRLALALALVAAVVAWTYPLQELWGALSWPRVRVPWLVDERRVAEAVARAVHAGADAPRFSEELSLLTWSGFRAARARYLIDEAAQTRTRLLFQRYKPDYGALVALDAATGRVVTLVSYSKGPSELGHLALRALFPAASIFKVVTAAAAIDGNLLDPDSILTFRGRDHTLYRRNLTEKDERWARRITLREAFAKSVNTVFGKIGAFVLKPPALDEYSRRFLFNRLIPGDVSAEPGHFSIGGPEDPWELAELASGFNRMSQMSPLQGALIGAAIANDGLIMEPHLVETIADDRGRVVYAPVPRELSRAVSPESAEKLRVMMRETVRQGTSRKSFRGFLRRFPEAVLDVGGKTGSLSGALPRGKCDWFVGYLRYADRRLAIAVLTVNDRWAPVKSSYLARAYFEHVLTTKEVEATDDDDPTGDEE